MRIEKEEMERAIESESERGNGASLSFKASTPSRVIIVKINECTHMTTSSDRSRKEEKNSATQRERITVAALGSDVCVCMVRRRVLAATDRRESRRKRECSTCTAQACVHRCTHSHKYI